MGMFDSIKYEYKLPLPTNDKIKALGIDVEDILFQTKDLDNCLSLYFINTDGRLIYKNVKYKWIDDDNAFLKGYMDEESHTMEDINYHGDISFYAYETIDRDDGKQITVSIDYKARFTNGNVTDIVLENYKITDTTERKLEQEKMFEELKNERNKWYNKYFFCTKLYNNLFRRPILGFFRGLNQTTQSVYYFISRHL